MHDSVAVLIATRNRAASLDQTLNSLARQRLHPRWSWRVVVVDNGSTDDTPAVLAKWRGSLPLESTTWMPPGKYRAINQALDRIAADLVLFTDDDVLAAPDWVSQHVAAAARWPDSQIFGGPVEALFPPGTPEWMTEPTYAGPVFSQLLPKLPEGPLDQPPFGNNLLIRGPVLASERYREDLGPQTGSYPIGGETEFLLRLERRGWHPIFVPGARVQHVIQPEHTTLEYLRLRAFNYGRGLAALGHFESDAPRVGRVPRYLWRELLEARWRLFQRTISGGLASRTGARFHYETLRGMIFELRTRRS